MIDWPFYNESLVRRGQVLLDFDVVDRWDHELSQMNLGKVGEPYCYPDSFIQLLGYMRAYFHLPYRQTQGVVIAHANKVPNTPHYSTISRRINRLEIKINERLGNDIIIALDSTGLKVANRGETYFLICFYLKAHSSKNVDMSTEDLTETYCCSRLLSATWIKAMDTDIVRDILVKQSND
jgi:hypothetical protein